MADILSQQYNHGNNGVMGVKVNVWPMPDISSQQYNHGNNGVMGGIVNVRPISQLTAIILCGYGC